jgi:ABC-type lipoprotein export system ATPase subunit
VTHDPSIAARAQRVLLMRDGTLMPQMTQMTQMACKEDGDLA